MPAKTRAPEFARRDFDDLYAMAGATTSGRDPHRLRALAARFRGIANAGLRGHATDVSRALALELRLKADVIERLVTIMSRRTRA